MTLVLESSVQAVNKNEKYIKDWLYELDEYYQKMVDFKKVPPDEIFRSIAGWTARASYIRSLVNRSSSKQLQTFRTQQIDPFLAECDRQFKIWSRHFSVEQLEAGTSNGRYT